MYSISELKFEDISFETNTILIDKTMQRIQNFREGNGRTQRVFLSQISINAGYEMDFSKIDTDTLMLATIHAANGVDIYLKEALREIISPIT